MKKDITTLEDVKTLVNTFYGKVQNDEELSSVFESVVQGNWEPHLEKMYTFWQTILLNERTYYGRPFPPHAKLPIGSEHFERWLCLFTETLQENFEGKKADEALWRANKMAEMFQIKLQNWRSRGIQPLI